MFPCCQNLYRCSWPDLEDETMERWRLLKVNFYKVLNQWDCETARGIESLQRLKSWGSETVRLKEELIYNNYNNYNKYNNNYNNCCAECPVLERRRSQLAGSFFRASGKFTIKQQQQNFQISNKKESGEWCVWPSQSKPGRDLKAGQDAPLKAANTPVQSQSPREHGRSRTRTRGIQTISWLVWWSWAVDPSKWTESFTLLLWTKIWC